MITALGIRTNLSLSNTGIQNPPHPQFPLTYYQPSPSTQAPRSSPTNHRLEPAVAYHPKLQTYNIFLSLHGLTHTLPLCPLDTTSTILRMLPGHPSEYILTFNGKVLAPSPTLHAQGIMADTTIWARRKGRGGMPLPNHPTPTTPSLDIETTPSDKHALTHNTPNPAFPSDITSSTNTMLTTAMQRSHDAIVTQLEHTLSLTDDWERVPDTSLIRTLILSPTNHLGWHTGLALLAQPIKPSD